MKDDFNASAEDRMQRLFDRLSKVPAGEAVVEFLKHHNVIFDLQENPVNWAASTLVITDVKNGEYHYKEPRIILKKGLSDDNLLQALVHETEHLNQHLSRVGNPDRILTTDQYILFYRAAEAHAQALATEVTYALKQAGDAGPWEATSFVGYADVCKAYEAAVKDDPAALSDGRGRRAAFDAWFGSADRLAGYNASLADFMIPFLKRGRDEVFRNHGMTEKPLDDTWLQKLDAAAGVPYLHLPGFRDVLADDYYARETGTRPKKAPAFVTHTNDNSGDGTVAPVTKTDPPPSMSL